MSETWEHLLAKSKGPWHTPAPTSRSVFHKRNDDKPDARVPDVTSTVDADLALVFAFITAPHLRYVPELKAWVFYDVDKARWVQDVAGDISAMHRLKQYLWQIATDKARQAYATTLSTGSESDAKKASDNIEKVLKSTAKLNAVWTQVKSEPVLVTSLKHFDSDPWLLNTPAGPIDLWSGEFLESSAEHLCLKQTTVAPKAGHAPMWEKVLEDAFPDDPETQHYVETCLALALVGDQVIQHFWTMSGEGGSGKGTILNTYMSLLGTGDTGYAMPVEAEFLMRQKADKHPEQYARLMGRRLVVSSESDRRQVFDAARVKNLTGNDLQSGRWMRGNTFTFKPTWKLFLMTNYRPRVDPEDTGFWRRFREIPFRHKPLEPISDLGNRLIEEEGPQIMARLIERLQEFLANGGVWAPETVQDATLENRAEQDTVSEFISDMCNVVEDDSVYTTNTALHEAYSRWSRLNGYDGITSVELGRKLTGLGLKAQQKKINGKNHKVRAGVQLVQESGASLY